MSFSSPRFLVFLAASLVVIGLLGSREAKKRALAAASCLFYAAWDWRYLGLLLAFVLIGFASARRMESAASAAGRKAWLWLSICSSLGFLGWFKYYDFFIGSANALLRRFGLEAPGLAIVLPVGISFYAFNSIAFAIDAYHRRVKPACQWLDYFNMITFFPALLGGPIVRGANFLPQMGRDIGPTKSRLVLGGGIFLQGLAKKMLLADRLATISNPIFADPQIYSTASVWLGLLAYSLQIYCDFSGYSDMAIGTAKMIGFDLPENFNLPYLSTNIAEFWRRWHISLSTWFRDYVFLPLAYASSRRLDRMGLSARKGNMASYTGATLLTMLLCGLWHGAGWTFVLWGGLHGAALVVHRSRLQAKGRKKRARSPVASWLATQLFVTLAWVLFRSPSLATASIVYKKLFGMGGAGAKWIPEWFFWCLPLIVLGQGVGVLLARLKRGGKGRLNEGFIGVLSWLGWGMDENVASGLYLRIKKVTILGSYALIFWMMVVFYFSPTQTSPFIYFNF